MPNLIYNKDVLAAAVFDDRDEIDMLIDSLLANAYRLEVEIVQNGDRLTAEQRQSVRHRMLKIRRLAIQLQSPAPQ